MINLNSVLELTLNRALDLTFLTRSGLYESSNLVTNFIQSGSCQIATFFDNNIVISE